MFQWRYTVRIENLSADQTVTLRERHWKIYSTGNKMEEVKGKGVIGYVGNNNCSCDHFLLLYMFLGTLFIPRSTWFSIQ